VTQLLSNSLESRTMFDRLGASTPSMGQRSYSPAARRPSPLAATSRAPYNPRSSSLSLPSRGNSSTESLPRPSREINGSALRREPMTVPNFEDPLQVLERIVGLPLPVEHTDAEDEPVKKPTDLSEDIDLHGLSLEDFAARKPEATTPAKRYNYSAESAEECEYVLQAEIREAPD
jgi:vacuolar protein sorting-associated protein 52